MAEDIAGTSGGSGGGLGAREQPLPSHRLQEGAESEPKLEDKNDLHREIKC